MREKEDILILFNGEHLAYSPTVIQLYDQLSGKYNVTITAEHPINFNSRKLTDRTVLYHRRYHVKGRHFYLLLFQFAALFNREAAFFKKHDIGYKEYYFRFLFIKNLIRKNKYKRIISVDIMNLLFCSILKVPTDFLSLELCADEQYLPLIDPACIKSVIIQSDARYEYLFKEKKLKTWFVQNAPAFREIGLQPEREGLIYAGTACNPFGFYHCLNYLRKYTEERLTVQGAVMIPDRDRINNEYKQLLDDKRLIVNTTYLENDEMLTYLSHFELGFCFYNFDDPVIKAGYFNYVSAPSGKMFKYLAAGVPVVCNNIPGFAFVDEFQCGVLIDDLNEGTIRAAIEKIRSNYDLYAANTLKAARHYDFDSAIAPYIAEINAT